MQKHLLVGVQLENFMLHRSTRLELSERPVLLLTGANGSGKTQVLDALLVAMGHHPKRVKKGSLAELVGAFGKEATVRLRLANPKTGGARPLKCEDAEVLAHLDADEVEVVARIDAESGLSYAIAGKGGVVKRVRRQDVRMIFDAVGVDADNRLAFTEEGTVNVFADHSARAKLEWTLETTGLAAYRNNLLEAIESTDKALAQIEPMKARLRVERDFLSSLEKSIGLVRRREELEARLAELVLEEAWARVAEVERRIEEARDRIAERRSEADAASGRLDAEKEALAKVERDLAALETREREERETFAAARSRVDRAEGAIGTRREVARTLEARRKKVKQDLRRLGAHLEKEAPSDRRLAELEVELEPFLASGWFRPARALVRRTIRAALLFRKKADEAGIRLLAGPLFRELRWPEGEADRRALAGLLGPALFGFLVADAKNLERAHALLLDTWPERLPPLVLLQDGRIEPPDCPKGVRPVEDLVDEDSPAARLLALSTPGGFVDDDDGSATELRRLAMASGRNLTRPDLRDYAFASGAVGGAFDLRLGSLDPAALELEAIDRAEEAHRELEEIRSALVERGLRGAPREGGDDAALRAERIRQLEERAHEAEAELHRVEADLLRLAAEHEKDLAAAEKTRAILDRIEEDRTELRTSRRGFTRAVEELSTRVQSAQAVLERFAEDLEEAKTSLAEEGKAAKEAGKRPRVLRDRRAVHDERIRVEVQLDEIRATRVSLERYEEQKEKVERMEAELAGSSEHIEHLRADMRERFDAWHKEVEERIGRMADGVNRLLAGVYDGVRLRVDNLHDANRAGFHMEVRRRGKAWRDLVHLSGGEKVLAVEALILSMHLLTDSPLHAIDEFTQRLDLEFKAYALDMVVRTVQAAGKAMTGPYAPQFLLLCPDTIGIEFDDSTRKLFQRVVISSTRPSRGAPRETVVEEVGA